MERKLKRKSQRPKRRNGQKQIKWMLNGLVKACVREEIRAASNIIQTKKRRRKRTRSTSEKRRHPKKDKKDTRKDPEVPVRQEYQTSLYATIFRNGNTQKNSQIYSLIYRKTQIVATHFCDTIQADYGWLFQTCLIVCLFVLETIRTSTMRVIHITVKTEETQRLRIKFVLYCPT